MRSGIVEDVCTAELGIEAHEFAAAAAHDALLPRPSDAHHMTLAAPNTDDFMQHGHVQQPIMSSRLAGAMPAPRGPQNPLIDSGSPTPHGAFVIRSARRRAG